MLIGVGGAGGERLISWLQVILLLVWCRRLARTGYTAYDKDSSRSCYGNQVAGIRDAADKEGTGPAA